MRKKFKILIADNIDLSNIKILPKSQYTVDINFGISNSAILKSKVSYDGIIIRSTRIIDEAFLSKCNLKLIATCSKGVDHIDVSFAKKKKIEVINCLEGNNIATVFLLPFRDLAFVLVLCPLTGRPFLCLLPL
ncbi:hypothetical protein ACFLSV_03510 [Bacteroidota bacterium]